MDPLSPQQFESLRDAHRRVLDRIHAAATRAGRSGDDITLVAVTKSASIEQIAALLSLGQIDLGENRVQQLDQRAKALTAENLPSPRWHMIGHLQRNKVKQMLPLVCLIHSIDSQRLAAEVNRVSEELNVVSDVLLQVNIAEEEQKYGLSTDDAPSLAQQLNQMKHLRLRGIMTMAPYDDAAESSRPVFQQAAILFENIRNALSSPPHFDQLSMGMSNDYEVAIEEGANVVRVGRALF